MCTSNKMQNQRNHARVHSFAFIDVPDAPVQFLQQISTPKIHNLQQKQAEGVLIEIGEFDSAPYKSNTHLKQAVSINSWIAHEQSRETKHTTNNQCMALWNRRNTRSMTQDYKVTHLLHQSNTISKLKLALKNLESPEKKRKQQMCKENKTVILQSLIKKRNSATKVKDLIRIKQCPEKHKYSTQNHKQMIWRRNISTTGSQRCNWNLNHKGLSSCLSQKIKNDLLNEREARKSRTLKNILQ